MEKISGIDFIGDFYLAGGTALALLLGHRQSIDFDFFSKEKHSPLKILDALGAVTNEKIEIKEQDEDTLIAFINNVKVSFFFYKHKLLDDTIKIKENISVANLKDIFAMKLIAISQRGTKKDFIDLYFLLKNGLSISDSINILEKKYENIKFNTLHILKSLLYFEDANNDLMPLMLIDTSWEEVKSYITKEAQGFLDKVLSCPTNNIIL